MNSPLHITFGRSAETTLKESFKTNNDLVGDIIALTEDLSMGPIMSLHNETGRNKRNEWLFQIGANTSSLSVLLESDLENYKLIKSFLGKRNIYIWCGSDSKSHLGFLRLIYELYKFPDRIFTLQYPKKIQYPIGEFPFVNIGILAAKDIGYLNTHFELLKRQQFGTYLNEWLEICNHDSVLRVEGDYIEHVQEDYWDELIVSWCTTDFKESARVVGEVLADIFDQWKTANHWYLDWRLKELVRKDTLDYRGVLHEMRDYSIKIKH